MEDDFDVEKYLGDPFIPGKLPLSAQQKKEIERAIRIGDEETLGRLGLRLAANAEEFVDLVQRLSRSAGSN
jgi:hypothetical protein